MIFRKRTPKPPAEPGPRQWITVRDLVRPLPARAEVTAREQVELEAALDNQIGFTE